jgi:hypothetical protein
MKVKSGLTWESNILLNRYLEDCGVQCELVTPQMLAAPFYRGKFVSLVIPTGFGNQMYSNLLPALRASSSRIKKFVNNGGNVLVFGAMDAAHNTYDWLPFSVRYNHEYFNTKVVIDGSDEHCAILDDFGTDEIQCDGHFSGFEGKIVASTEDGKVLMICNHIGKGKVVITSFHEYPSRKFLKGFCTADRETLF